MKVSLVPICVVVGGRLAPHGAQQLANWHLIPHGNAGDRGAGNRSPR
jgi:hypothetical protein